MTFNFETYSLSFIGRRESNQDSLLIFKPSTNSLFLAVADGMGGVAGGKVASELIIKNAKKTLLDYFKNDIKPLQLKEILIKIFNISQGVIKKTIKEKPELNGMGSTLTCVLILEEKFVWGNLGDSRIYLFSNNQIKQITKDHTHIQDFIDKYDENLPDNLSSNYGHYLTRSIDGSNDEPDIFPDVKPFEILNENSVLLLCSDGLIVDKSINQEELLRNYLVGTKTLEEAAENLISRAYHNGANDNITVILAQKGEIKREKKNIKKFTYPCILETKTIKEGEKNLKNKKTHKRFKKLTASSYIIISSIIILSFGIGYFSLNKTRLNSDRPYLIPKNLSKNILNKYITKNTVDKNKIAFLLKKARKYILEKKLTKPKNENAYDVIKIILNLDKNNIGAANLLVELALKFNNLGDKQVEKRKYKNAANFYKKSLTFYQKAIGINKSDLKLIQDKPIKKQDLFISVSNGPKIIGGYNKILKKLKKLKIVKEKKIKGNIVIDTFVDSKGMVTNALIKRGLQKDFDKIAIQIVKKSKFELTYSEGKPINVHFNLMFEIK